MSSLLLQVHLDMHKNYKLLILLILLATASLTLTLTSGVKSRSNYRVDLFSFPDTAQILSIKISGNQEVVLKKSAGVAWKVNDLYGVNSNLRTVLLAVLSQVKVRRPVSQIQRVEIANNLENALRVLVETEAGLLDFYAGGNAARTQAYFMLSDDDQPYIVEIPGYRNYLSGIFELTEMQWRDRTLFNTNWRSLQSLKVTYPDGGSGNALNIYFEDQFFKIHGVAAMDTTRLMEYLSAYELFEANEFIPAGFRPRYDSLAQTGPLAIIELSEINQDRNQRLTIFGKLENDNFILTSNKEGQLSLVDFGRIRQLLISPGDLSL